VDNGANLIEAIERNMNLLFIFAITAFTGAALVATPIAANAQVYPAKPVRLIVPFAPGGGNDVIARLLGQKLSETWKQQVVVENRPGAGGNIGAELVAKAPPDGYTLLLGHTGVFAINPSLYPKLSYDSQKDFSPVSLLATAPLVLVVHPNVPANSLRELIALAKAQPGKLNYASSGSGTGAHLSGELLRSMAKVDLTHVPYKGTAPAMTDLMGGQVQMMFSVLPAVLPHIRSGKLKAIAVTGKQQTSLLPGVPTMAESGVPGYVSTLSYGVLAPAKTPDAVVKEINGQVAKVLATPEFRERLAFEGAEPLGGSPADFAAVIKAETEKWAKVVKDSGAKAE
jgi:tripartite-type tricarboxylate transporter receptor subunit TctC